MIWRCDLVPQYEAYKQEVDAAIQGVLQSGRYTLGPNVRSFEEEFARYMGIPHGISVANGTDAIILALMALGVGPGDEVITTPFTAIPTASAIIRTGAKPVFVDVDRDTYLIDLACVQAAITEKTRAVVPVHLFGNVVDIPKLRTIVGEEIIIVEDACQAHGSRIGDKKAGTMGDAGAFSFYPTKNLGGYGDGGMVVTRNAELDEKLRLMRMYGMTDKDHIVINGINSRLDELEAAILRVKLKHLDAMNQARNQVVGRYKSGLPDKLFRHQTIPDTIYSNFHVFVSDFKGDRAAFINYMDEREIQTNIYYPLPLHLQEANAYLGYKPGDLPVAEELCEKVIALPHYPELPEQTQSLIIDTVNRFANNQDNHG